jgi:hypothetical protein
MSLDVYLEIPGSAPSELEDRIFIRRGGQTVEISREEWNAMYPDDDPVTIPTDRGSVYEANITHNLNKMAAEAGIYEALWRPEEIGITTARQLIEHLELGLAALRSDPKRFEALNPSNGWGSYRDFVPWVERYLQACVLWPDATVRVWR